MRAVFFGDAHGFCNPGKPLGEAGSGMKIELSGETH
jgi:hypothetical protein